ncbi:DUF2379 family protein [Stigmatella aurantiaca]|uniref:DUF2379 family protein n=1 Tax=Stigmatella aurantiaca TaxID=41 RepID=UPI00094AD2C4|nr:DUF2379 family protein [Stigmatella aurantiaca]
MSRCQEAGDLDGARQQMRDVLAVEIVPSEVGPLSERRPPGGPVGWTGVGEHRLGRFEAAPEMECE